jgi:hypothetical protein
MSNAFTIQFDKAAVAERIKGLAAKATAIIANEALKDANEYTPSDSGELTRSSIRSSQPDKGLLVWDTPYARYQYYGVSILGKSLTYHTDGTPAHAKACALWAQRSYDVNRAKYQRMAQAIADGG